jgi:hypothetical protein
MAHTKLSHCVAPGGNPGEIAHLAFRSPFFNERGIEMKRFLSTALLLLCSAGWLLAQGEPTSQPPIQIPGLKVKTQIDFDGTVSRPLYQEIMACRLVDTRADSKFAAPYGGPSFDNETRTYSVSGTGKTNPCTLENRTASDGDARPWPSAPVAFSVLVRVYNAESTPLAGAFSVASASATPGWFGWNGPGILAAHQDAIVRTADQISVSITGAKADVTLDLLGYFVDDHTPSDSSGLIGAPGEPGPQGEPGPRGLKGDTGATGAAGPIGSSGPQGAQGVKGDKGDTGAIGPQGTQGVKGDNGDSGAIGPQGIQGVKGDKGDTGAIGPQGIQGVKGDKGDTGAIGPQGTQGVKGDKGDTGATGSQGIQGAKGDTGAQGIQGTQGPSGSQGPQGPAGPGTGSSDACAVLEQIKGCLGDGNTGFGPFRDCIAALICPQPPSLRTVRVR